MFVLIHVQYRCTVREGGGLGVHLIISIIKPAPVCVCGGGGGVQAYSRLSTTHGHITDCKLDSMVYAGVMGVCAVI